MDAKTTALIEQFASALEAQDDHDEIVRALRNVYTLGHKDGQIEAFQQVLSKA